MFFSKNLVNHRNITTDSKFGLECRRIYEKRKCLNELHGFFPLSTCLQIETDEMSPAVTKTKKRKATEIDSNESKEEQVAKAKKVASGERKY